MLPGSSRLSLLIGEYRRHVSIGRLDMLLQLHDGRCRFLQCLANDDYVMLEGGLLLFDGSCHRCNMELWFVSFTAVERGCVPSHLWNLPVDYTIGSATKKIV